MAQIIQFRGVAQSSLETNTVAAPVRSSIDRHLDRYQWNFGRDAYWFFVTEKGKLPDRLEAEGLAALLGLFRQKLRRQFLGRGTARS